MIDEQGYQVIVMLCQLAENKKKCENYWNTEFTHDIQECDDTKWIFRQMLHKEPNSNIDKIVNQIH
jgi:protein tyrosine phosphatase